LDKIVDFDVDVDVAVKLEIQTAQKKVNLRHNSFKKKPFPAIETNVILWRKMKKNFSDLFFRCDGKARSRS
jgi:hypothetical protein